MLGNNHKYLRNFFSLRPARRRSRSSSSIEPGGVCGIESLENRALLAAAFPEFIDPSPSVDNGFGAEFVPLSTGNVVITSPFDDAGGTDAGAVYLFNGSTGELISTLAGSQNGDRIGGQSSSSGKAVTALTNGNFVIASPRWANAAQSRAGAVTFGDGVTGVSGTVSAENSLVGTIQNQQLGVSLRLGESAVVSLPSGDYVLTSVDFQNGSVQGAGAVTHGNGSTGTVGVISSANSLVGTRPGDFVGGGGVTVLTNGNYVILSAWNSPDFAEAGAVTLVDGDTGP